MVARGADVAPKFESPLPLNWVLVKGTTQPWSWPCWKPLICPWLMTDTELSGKQQTFQISFQRISDS